MTQPPAGTGSPGPDPYERTGLGQPAEPLDTAATSHDAHPSVAGLSGATAGGGDFTSPSQSSPDDAKSTAGQVADTTKGEAKQVAGTAVDSAKQVAETAKSEVGNVATEAKQQATSLLDTVRSEVGSQVGTQQNRIADAVHGLSKELGGMASGSEQSGPLTDLAHEASRRGGEIAHWLQDKEPADVLESVRSYARRRPGTFLILCGLAGVVAGRLTRSAVATRTELDNKDSDAGAEGRGRDYVAQRAVTPYATEVPSPYGSGTAGSAPYGSGPEFAAPYADQPVDPGRYGSAPVDRAPYGSEPPMPGSGFVGTTEPSADPNAGPVR